MDIKDFHRIVPTYENGIWTETEFTDLQDFRDFVKSTFKEPGKYELDETSQIFNKQARDFIKNGEIYCMATFRSKDFIDYWDDQKLKSRNGAIFKNNNKTWYLPRDYYF